MITNLGLLVLRLGVGLMMLYSHGWEKLVNFSMKSATFADPLGVGSEISLGLVVFAEVFCATAVSLGFFTRIFSIPLFATMFIAIFLVHGDQSIEAKETAILYAIPFLTLIFTGGGSFSLSKLLGK